jgi:hypothetical protein
MNSSDTGLIYFDEVRVPQRNRIGNEGQGFIYQMQQFQEERLWAAASCLVSLERCLAWTIEWAQERKLFGGALADQQYVQFKLAEMKTELESLRALTYRACELYVGGQDVLELASMAKLKAGRLNRIIPDGCLQFWGGMGFTWENKVSRMYRDGRLGSIGGGADEVMLGILAKIMGIARSGPWPGEPMRRLLIANRGEIARRIIRTAHAMGIATVAVHSDADAQALHVREATASFALLGNASAHTYLRIDKLLAAASATGADAVHPGYGFLSENADFAQAVIDAGLIWVGPPPAGHPAAGQQERGQGDRAGARRALPAGLPRRRPVGRAACGRGAAHRPARDGQGCGRRRWPWHAAGDRHGAVGGGGAQRAQRRRSRLLAMASCCWSARC